MQVVAVVAQIVRRRCAATSKKRACRSTSWSTNRATCSRPTASGTASGSTRWNIARPALFLIDPDGAIRYSFVGEKQDEFPSHEEIVDALSADDVASAGARQGGQNRRVRLTVDA